MDKKEFKQFCHNEFVGRGFKRKKSMYYLRGLDDILCGIWLKQSNYGSVYTVMFYYFFDNAPVEQIYPLHHEYDLVGYIKVLSKDTVRGQRYFSGTIDYEKYTEEELKPYFDRAFEEYILPPIELGKAQIIAYNEHLTAHHTRSKNEVIDELRRDLLSKSKGSTI